MSAEEVPGLAASPAVKTEQDLAMSDDLTPVLQNEVTSTHTTPAAAMPRPHPANGSANANPIAMPAEPAHHGAPTRDWINTKITGVLLEGMKLIAIERPEAPLRALGEYLLRRSAEIEGTGTTGEVVNGH